MTSRSGLTVGGGAGFSISTSCAQPEVANSTANKRATAYLMHPLYRIHQAPALLAEAAHGSAQPGRAMLLPSGSRTLPLGSRLRIAVHLRPSASVTSNSSPSPAPISC